MKIAVLGAGYVGLVTGACLADSGNEVTCVDIDQAKIDGLNQGRVPIYEPGLEDLIKRNVAAGRLFFTTSTSDAVAPARLVMVAVGTPEGEGGGAELSILWKAIEGAARHLRPDAVLVLKSTVPVGTNAQAARRLEEWTGRAVEVANNPEFLKQGAAVEDFQKPDRVVIGTRSEEAAAVLRELYAPFLRTERPLLQMTPESAEATKYVANAMLATKISFINEMANICERIGADIHDVRRGIGFDERIGFQFLFPGVGYGGSCFPKDVRALVHIAECQGVEPRILRSVDEVNRQQRRALLDKVVRHFGGDVAGKPIAVWGLAFKPRTDDIREAPSLDILKALLEKGAKLSVHDPEAMPRVRSIFGEKLRYAARSYEALDGAEALVILTEWGDYRQPDFAQMRQRMKTPVIFDGRNLYERATMQAEGFSYYCVGRPPVEKG